MTLLARFTLRVFLTALLCLTPVFGPVLTPANAGPSDKPFQTFSALIKQKTELPLWKKFAEEVETLLPEVAAQADAAKLHFMASTAWSRVLDPKKNTAEEVAFFHTKILGHTEAGCELGFPMSCNNMFIYFSGFDWPEIQAKLKIDPAIGVKSLLKAKGLLSNHFLHNAWAMIGNETPDFGPGLPHIKGDRCLADRLVALMKTRSDTTPYHLGDLVLFNHSDANFVGEDLRPGGKCSKEWHESWEKLKADKFEEIKARLRVAAKDQPWLVQKYFTTMRLNLWGIAPDSIVNNYPSTQYARDWEAILTSPDVFSPVFLQELERNTARSLASLQKNLDRLDRGLKINDDYSRILSYFEWNGPKTDDSVSNQAHQILAAHLRPLFANQANWQ